MSALDAARDLQEASRALLVVLESAGAEEGKALTEALERRTRAFEALLAAADQPISDEVRALLAEVQALDRRAIDATRARMATAREELEQLRGGRALARRLGEAREPEPARFVSRRV